MGLHELLAIPIEIVKSLGKARLWDEFRIRVSVQRARDVSIGILSLPSFSQGDSAFLQVFAIRAA